MKGKNGGWIKKEGGKGEINEGKKEMRKEAMNERSQKGRRRVGRGGVAE